MLNKPQSLYPMITGLQQDYCALLINSFIYDFPRLYLSISGSSFLEGGFLDDGFSMTAADFDKSDRDIWRDFKNGDEQTYAFIYQEFTPILFKYGMKLLPNRELVKDAIQDLFIYLWEARERLSPTDSIKYYLFRALRRTVAARTKTTTYSLDDSFLEEQTENQVPSSEDSLIEKQTQDHYSSRLVREIDLLPRRQKEAVFLRFYSNMEFDEISVLMGISVRAVYKLIYKAIDLIKKNMLIQFASLIALLMF